MKSEVGLALQYIGTCHQVGTTLLFLNSFRKVRASPRQDSQKLE